jgi:hypothetical protein
MMVEQSGLVSKYLWIRGVAEARVGINDGSGVLTDEIKVG